MIGGGDIPLFLADFGVACAVGATTFQAIFDRPGEVLDYGASVGAVSTQYQLTCAQSDATAAALANGTAVTVDGQDYKVRGEPLALDDGAFVTVMLTRVSP